jgi:hypothetical protein
VGFLGNRVELRRYLDEREDTHGDPFARAYQLLQQWSAYDGNEAAMQRQQIFYTIFDNLSDVEDSILIEAITPVVTDY